MCVGWAVHRYGARLDMFEDAVLTPLSVLIGYGMFVWPLFIGLMLGLDTILYLVLVNSNSRSFEKILTGGMYIECILVGSPFLYWAVTLDYPLWYLLVIVLAFSQILLRKNKIQQLLALPA